MVSVTHMGMYQQRTKQMTYEVKVWEKAEHWYFYATVEASNDKEAWNEALKEWKRSKGYRVMDVRPKN